MNIEAFIFDMDGTIVDTGNLWIESALEANKIHGFDKSDDEIKSYIGTGKRDEYCLLVKAIFNRKIEGGELRAKEGIHSLLETLRDNKIKIAIATSSGLEKVKKRLRSAQIDISYFDEIITGDMVEKNKPNPEIYITACKQLGVSPMNAIVLEDSDVGIKSATDAKIKAILIPDVVKTNRETEKNAFKILSSLTDVEKLVSSIPEQSLD